MVDKWEIIVGPKLEKVVPNCEKCVPKHLNKWSKIGSNGPKLEKRGPQLEKIVVPKLEQRGVRTGKVGGNREHVRDNWGKV